MGRGLTARVGREARRAGVVLQHAVVRLQAVQRRRPAAGVIRGFRQRDVLLAGAAEIEARRVAHIVRPVSGGRERVDPLRVADAAAVDLDVGGLQIRRL